MKKIILMLLLVSSMSIHAQKPVKADLIVKQEITFVNSSEKIDIYYVKEGEHYAVYSDTDLNKQNPAKLNNVKSSSFIRTSNYKGTRYLYCKSLSEVVSIANELYKKYKNLINL